MVHADAADAWLLRSDCLACVEQQLLLDRPPATYAAGAQMFHRQWQSAVHCQACWTHDAAQNQKSMLGPINVQISLTLPEYKAHDACHSMACQVTALE